MAKTGRHEFVIDKRSTPIAGTNSKPRGIQENQDTLRTYGNYSRQSKWANEPWPSIVER